MGELFPGGDDLQNVRLAGQPPDRQGEAVEPLAVVLVGKGGLRRSRAPQQKVVACFIHMYAHLIGSPGDWPCPG